MRILPFVLSAAVTTGLVWTLNGKIGALPAMGKLLSPSHGLWKNAEPSNGSFSVDIRSEQLQNEVNVYLDERLVPHVFAKNNHDAFFVQGWLHARFRLWQMEFQASVAAGRLSEILGETVKGNSVLQKHDRKMRRLGMVYAAERTLKKLKDYPEANEAIEAYTAGVNAYTSQLLPADYPLEYKLLDYSPEEWTPLKTLLMYKYLSYDLTTDFDDFDYTNALQELGLPLFDKVYPPFSDSSKPVIPKGTLYAASRPLPAKPAGADSLYLHDTTTMAFSAEKQDPDKGSNNWVVAGSKTASGRPILCNDPHLGLNLPSLWYEVQINTPEFNVYGVSLPGTPAVIIGFNDSIAWGLTNAYRDVMDFYEVQFKDSTMNEYWFDSSWRKTEWRNEVIRIRGKADYVDKIALTEWGPVMFDATYESALKNKKAYAVKWTAHEPTPDAALSMLQLAKANNYQQFQLAIKDHGCPGQNIVFASKANDIAMCQMGLFPAKWRRQGDFVMPGFDSSYAWQGYIPFEDMPREFNPVRGFCSSANQIPVDSTYPYYISNASYDVFRGYIINRMLNGMQGVTVADMQRMQNDNYNVFAEMARPILLKYVNENELNAEAKPLLGAFKQWDLRADANETGMTVFFNWWLQLQKNVWNDDVLRSDNRVTPMPPDHILLEGLLRDSTAFVFIDNKQTEAVETLSQQITAALNKAADELSSTDIDWVSYKGTRVNHLLKIDPFSRMHLSIGGGAKMINCTKQDHGPSWRMIVQMTDDTEAYGVYPGGQNGNPGSRYYDQFVNNWVTGAYYKLWMMKNNETSSDKVKWVMRFSKV